MQNLLNLLAGVSLLVWATHIVRTGILRIYGGDLRRILRHSVRNRFSALTDLAETWQRVHHCRTWESAFSKTVEM